MSEIGDGDGTNPPPPRSMEERVTALQKELERRDNEMAAMMAQMQALMGQLTTIASGVGTSQTPASSARQDAPVVAEDPLLQTNMQRALPNMPSRAATAGPERSNSNWGHKPNPPHNNESVGQ